MVRRVPDIATLFPSAKTTILNDTAAMSPRIPLRWVGGTVLRRMSPMHITSSADQHDMGEGSGKECREAVPGNASVERRLCLGIHK